MTAALYSIACGLTQDIANRYVFLSVVNFLLQFKTHCLIWNFQLKKWHPGRTKNCQIYQYKATKNWSKCMFSVLDGHLREGNMEKLHFNMLLNIPSRTSWTVIPEVHGKQHQKQNNKFLIHSLYHIYFAEKKPLRDVQRQPCLC